MMQITHRTVPANGINLHVAQVGTGPAILLLHGWPHTWMLWRDVMPPLAEAGFRAIAPDLRGLGGSTRAAGGYDLATLSTDMVGLLDALAIERALVVGIDIGAPVAFLLAARCPGRVSGLVLSESLLGDLPGAEAFLAHAPWWFGFHAVPDLPELVIEGHEDRYIDWFLRAHTRDHRGIAPDVRDAFVAAYQGREALRCGFEYYRAFPQQAGEIRAVVAGHPALPPALSLVGGVVGDAIHRQLIGIAPDARHTDIADCGHLVPLEQPAQTAAALIGFARDIAPWA